MVATNEPDLTFHSIAERFYAVLQAAKSDSKADAERLLPVAEMQVERHRQIVVELRSLQERAEAELDRWATAAANLRATVDPNAAPGGAEFGGKKLAAVAQALLEQSGKHTMHYRDLAELIRDAGYQIAGVNPDATLLSALGKAKQWESIGDRTGLWKIAEASE